MPKPDVTVILTITGVLFSFITIGLLVTSQIKQNWISYTFASAGTVGGVPFTAITNADIGIWETSFIIVATTAFGSTTTTDTLDSATTDYFSEDAVKLCRALGILATVSTFATIVLAIVTLVIPKETILRLGLSTKTSIAILCTNGFTVFTAMLALIVVRRQFKDGMSIDTSFYIAIAADIISAFAFGMFITTFIITRQHSKGAPTANVLPLDD
ncbi:unnamed protein product [Mytilus edulis]|uniref:Uncharacterized protein n=1 Tax=Mytilus edulis TaxID=6550 RepID=A0A8S3SVY7_MYTED|nr:unnamed protein product [Mytilus edulis]